MQQQITCPECQKRLGDKYLISADKVADYFYWSSEPLENYRDRRLYELEKTVDSAHAAISHNVRALRYVANKLFTAEQLLPEERTKS